MSAVEVKNLSVSYESGRKILDGINLNIEKGESVVIAGLSGCGKTTLCHTLCGVIPKLIPGTVSGEINILGESIKEKSPPEIALKIGLVFQNPDEQMICTTVEDEIAFGLENLCVEPEEIEKRVDDILKFFNLDGYKLHDPGKLSGGQKKLVTIAGVLVLEPEILILDEPMTGLDGGGRALVRQIIDKLHENGKTIIVVEHDLSLAGYADRIIYLKDGKLYDKC